MFSSFNDIYELAKKNGKKRMSVACAADETVLSACYEASQMGIAEAVLTGKRDEISPVLEKLDIATDYFEIIDSDNNRDAILKAVKLVRDGDCKFILKGFTQTADFLRGVLDKEVGLRTGRLLSHTAIVEIKKFNRIIQYTDGGMNIYPDLDAKVQILKNAIELAHAMQIEIPNVAVLGPVETVNPDIRENIDGAILSKMGQRGQLGMCNVEGPLAMDIILSKEAAEHKKLNCDVCGNTDIILVPNLVSGNSIVKTMVYTSDIELGGLILGAKAPCLLLSRADTLKTKLNSIALGNVVTD
ncbi:MAG: phosphate butyryltransferase [Proteobacteria bacterium]|nr:phosphate butyryltransferase [Pseudomonadota bacterium]